MYNPQDIQRLITECQREDFKLAVYPAKDESKQPYCSRNVFMCEKGEVVGGVTICRGAIERDEKDLSKKLK